MAYTLTITEADGKVRRKEINSRKEALFHAEASSCPMNIFGIFETEERYVEVTDGKGIRIFDAAVPQGSVWALAWRDSKRTWIRGFPTKEEAEQAQRAVSKGCETAVLRASERLPWSVGPGYTKPVQDLEEFEKEVRESGGFIVGEDDRTG